MPVIVLEGPNGSGTSTQCNKLKEYLDGIGKQAIIARTPGSTDLGKELRKILKFGDLNLSVKEELMLFAADGISFFENYINQLHDEWIICDRSNLTSIVYQQARGASISQVMAIYDVLRALGWNCKFGYLFVLTSDYKTLKNRLESPNTIDEDKKYKNRKDNFELNGDDFLDKVCENYKLMLQNDVVNVKSFFNKTIEIDASKSVDEVFNQIISEIEIG